MKIREIIEVCDAEVLSEIDLDLEIKISTDTRTIQKGDFYLPLKGASFDGEKFIDQAIEKGAVGAFCTGEKGTLKVKDTLEAYLKLANYRRKILDFRVVAITGSSGKTTTKEIVASTLSQSFKTFKTPLNHNNEIGFCQTIFETPDDTEVLVLEMGMRGLGEIELLSKYSEPDITIISNVGTAHIGRLGSRENIAKAKCEIVKYQRGKTFIAHDDELIKNTVEFNGEKIFYSINNVKILEKGILGIIEEIDEDRPNLTKQEIEEVEIQIKYEGYIKLQDSQVEKFKKLESKKLNEEINYFELKGLSLEARQKLDKIKPLSIGQASRISGVSPADISVLLIYLEQQKRK